MTPQEIEDNYIEIVSDWQIVKKICQRYEAEATQEVRDKHNADVRYVQEEKERADARARAYNRPTYYQESAMQRGQRMRAHNDCVASQGYGSSYF